MPQPKSDRKFKVLTLCLPFIAILIFFGLLEGALWLGGFTPHLRVADHQVPFWLRHDASVMMSIDQIVRNLGRVTPDVRAFEEDYRLFYKLRPNLNLQVPFYDWGGFEFASPFPDWHIITDSQGHRVASHVQAGKQAKKDDAATYVAFLGGSSTFGWGVDYQKAYPAIVSEAIQQMFPDKRFRFVNHGVPGYAMSQHMGILEAMIAKHDVPDLIILDATSNCDVLTPINDRERDRLRSRAIEKLRFFMGRFKFFQFMEMMLLRIAPKPSSQFLAPRESLGDFGIYVKDFIRTARAHGISLALIGLCAQSVYVDRLADIGRDQDVPVISFAVMAGGYIRELKQQNTIGQVHELFRAHYGDEPLLNDAELYYLFPDKCHPNAFGHQLLANQVKSMVDFGL